MTRLQLGKPAKRVLIINAHADARHVLARLLRRRGFDCSAAADVAGAEDLCRGGPFDLIICDTHFGDGTCADLLRAQRAAHGTRGLAFSAGAHAHEVAAGLAAGFDGYLAQPASAEALAAAIGRVLAGPAAAAGDA